MALDIRGSLQGLQHFGLTVEDLDKSVEFYVEVLGGTLALSGDGFYGEELYPAPFPLRPRRGCGVTPPWRYRRR